MLPPSEFIYNKIISPWKEWWHHLVKSTDLCWGGGTRWDQEKNAEWDWMYGIYSFKTKWSSKHGRWCGNRTRRSEHLKNENGKFPNSTGTSHGQWIISIVAFHRLYLSWDGRFCSRHPQLVDQNQKLWEALLWSEVWLKNAENVTKWAKQLNTEQLGAHRYLISLISGDTSNWQK